MGRGRKGERDCTTSPCSLSHLPSSSLQTRKATADEFEFDCFSGEGEFGGAVVAFADVATLSMSSGAEDFAAKVAFVEAFVEHSLVDLLQLGQGELFGEQQKAEGCPSQFPTEPQCVLQDLRVQSPRRNMRLRQPASVASLLAAQLLALHLVGAEQRGAGNRDHP